MDALNEQHGKSGHVVDIANPSRAEPSTAWRALLNLPRPVAMAIAVVLLALIAYVDVRTSTDVSFAVWYLVPVVVVTWFVGRAAGYLMAVMSAAVWLYADLHGAAYYVRLTFAYLNAGTRLMFFLLCVAILSAFRNLEARLESIVEERTAALRRLAAQLSEAEDSQRRRLAFDIHDGFGQILTLLKLNLAASLPDTPQETAAHQRINDAVGMVNDLIDRSRTLTFELHPAMLDHLGLGPTLHRYAEQFSRRTNVDVTVSEDGTALQLPPMVANYLFRSAKELLNNAAKHGAARQIVIGLHWAGSLVRIVVDDDGAGFNADEVLAPGLQKGLGLSSIRERMLSLGGSFRLESSSGRGTRVVMELSLVTQETSE